VRHSIPSPREDSEQRKPYFSRGGKWRLVRQGIYEGLLSEIDEKRSFLSCWNQRVNTGLGTLANDINAGIKVDEDVLAAQGRFHLRMTYMLEQILLLVLKVVD